MPSFTLPQLSLILNYCHGGCCTLSTCKQLIFIKAIVDVQLMVVVFVSAVGRVRYSPQWSVWQELYERPLERVMWTAVDPWAFSFAPNTGDMWAFSFFFPVEALSIYKKWFTELSVNVCRINQARVYLQAYRVGYKIQCPQRRGRWASKQCSLCADISLDADTGT